MSAAVAVDGRLIVFDTALSTCFWKATWIARCASGGMSMAVGNRRRISSGTASIARTEPVLRTSATRSSE